MRGLASLGHLLPWTRDWQPVSIKDQIANRFYFACHMVSVAIT